MRLYRLIAILALLESRGSVKARELADALEVSVRTVYRDVETLCQAGIPVAATAGPNGGVRLMEGYAMNPVRLTGDDAVNLYLSGVAGGADAQGDGAARLRESLLRLEKTLPAAYGADIRAARERFFFDDAPWWGELAPPACLGILRQAVLRQRKLSIEYEKRDGSRSGRVVRPYGLVVKNGGWYLVAHCEQSGGLRTFKADRVARAETLQEGFSIPPGFDLERHWRSGVNNFLQERRGSEIYPVLIRLKSADQWLLEQLDVLESWVEGESILARVNLHRPEFAEDEALKILWHCRILSPESLRKRIARRLKALADEYESSAEQGGITS